MARRILLFVLLAAALAIRSTASAKVHAVSTDGEATVYLTDDFRRGFDVTYNVHFPPSQGNRSWTFISLLLLERVGSSGSIGVGLSRSAPHDARLSGFIDVGTTKTAPVYRSIPVRCPSACAIELRGNETAISASIDHRLLGTWTRRSTGLINPSIQINGEVTAIGDRIFARLTQIRALTGGHPMAPAACAFTTQGVHARAAANGALTFTGRRNPAAGATFVSLRNGATGDTCGEAVSKRPR